MDHTTSPQNQASAQFEPLPVDVMVVRAMLTRALNLPPEMLDLIIDHAEYWPHTESCMSHTRRQVRITSSRRGQENVMLLRTPPIGFRQDRIADLTSWMSDPSSLQPLEAELSHGFLKDLKPLSTLEHPVRKLVFSIRSRDQGWGGEPGHRGTFHGSWTWFEAGLERIDGNSDGEMSAQQEQPFNVEDLRSIIPAIEQGGNTSRYKHSLLPNEKYKIQCNKTATSEFTDHKIAWSWTDMVNENSPEAQRLAEKGRGKLSASGEFVRSLRLGDVVTVWGMARFPNWQNRVEEAKVSVYFAV